MSGATKKKTKPVWKKKVADPTPEAQKKVVVAEKTPAKKATTPVTTKAPPTKQQQRQNTLTTAPRVAPSVRTGPFQVKAPPRLPTAGIGERTTAEHVDAVRSTWDLKPLFDLAYALATQDPDRDDLIETVRRQIIRAQLALMMGGNNASRANIHVDGVHMVMTASRETDRGRTPDQRRDDLTADSDPARATDVWNASLRDTEVDTVRDVKAWARTLDKRTLAETERIVIDVVGTSGPCDACKERLQLMAEDIVAEWSSRTGLSADELPSLAFWSYYGNPPDRPQHRGRVKDVINGWVGDETPPDMEFWNYKRNAPQPVREHPFFRYNVKQPVETETTTEESDTATEKSGTAIEAPVTTKGKTDKSEDLFTSTEK